MGAGSHSARENLSRLVPVGSADQVKRDPGPRAPDQGAQGKLRLRMAPQPGSGPPHEGEQRRDEEAPMTDDEEEADQRPGSAGGVQRDLGERRQQGEGEGREGV